MWASPRQPVKVWRRLPERCFDASTWCGSIPKTWEETRPGCALPSAARRDRTGRCGTCASLLRRKSEVCQAFPEIRRAPWLDGGASSRRGRRRCSGIPFCVTPPMRQPSRTTLFSPSLISCRNAIIGFVAGEWAGLDDFIRAVEKIRDSAEEPTVAGSRRRAS